MNHDEEYPAAYLAGILKEIKTIAMVGASSDPAKFSYGVLRVLHETGYDMIPVNPMEAGTEIRGLKCYESLSSIERPVDMVQVFRTSEAAYGVTEEAIEIGAKVVWMQIGVRNDEASRLKYRTVDVSRGSSRVSPSTPVQLSTTVLPST